MQDSEPVVVVSRQDSKQLEDPLILPYVPYHVTGINDLNESFKLYFRPYHIGIIEIRVSICQYRNIW